MMQFGTQVAGLDQCDTRVSYDTNFKTSTPVKTKICAANNLECWERRGQDMSAIPGLDPMSGPDSDSSDNEVDISYGGHWSKFPDDTLAREGGDMMDPDYTEDPDYPDEDEDDELHRRLPHNDSLLLNNPIRAYLKGNSQVQFVLTEVAPNNFPPPGYDGKFLNHSNWPENVDPEQEVTDILNKGFCHKKSQADLKAEKIMTDPKLSFRTENLRIMVNNCRGYFSKRESIETIAASESLDIIVLCETFTSGKRYPELQGYTTYFRNRPKRANGGVAILIRDERARYVVKIAEGSEHNEYFGIKFSNCDPNLVIFVYYGAVSNTFGVDAKKVHLTQLLDDVSKYLYKGYSVQILGDFNLHIGNDKIPKNNPDSSPTGRLFCDMLDNLNLHVMNGLSDNPITYIDRSGPDHSENVLDLVITNDPSNISDFKTDDLCYNFTPYSIKMKGGKAFRTYADHMSIIFNYKTRWQDKIKFNKEPIWMYNTPLADVKYELFTNNACYFLMQKVMEEESIDKTHKAFKDVLTKAKFQSYNRRTVTASKVTRLNDQLVWRKRIEDLEQLERRFKGEKESNKIFKAKRVILKGPEDKQNYRTENEDTGEVLEDLDDILTHVLNFNAKNMTKIDPEEDVAAVMRKKAEIIEELLSDHNVDKFPSSIPWETYLKVLEKVMRQRKSCFRDLIKAGRDYKFALFFLINRIYACEEFPEDSAVTFLTRIYKGKGSKEKLGNNRFIHNKEPLTKMFEKCVVELVSEALNNATPQAQAGSRKGRSTRDQMLKVLILQKFHESKSKPLPVLLVDVKACFDKIPLQVVIHDTLEAGADAKATRVLNKLSSRTEIRLTGDRRNNGKGESRIVTQTLGQGTNYAPGGIGLSSSKSVDQEFTEDEKNQLMAAVGTARSDPLSYVDDISAFPKNEPCLRKVSVKVGEALRGIGLESHPKKTEVIISGRSVRAEKMRTRLTDKPAMMQNNPIKVAKTGMYLGMVISDLGFRDSIDKTARHRVAKAWGCVADIKSVINDSRLARTGWLRAGITLIRAQIIPSLTYSADTWLGANKCTEKFISDAYKSIIYAILDLKTNTKFTSVLADLGLPNIVAVMDKLRVNFVNHTLWAKGDEKLRETLLEERRLLPKNNLLDYTDKICEKYNLPAVSDQELDKRLVKKRIRVVDEIDTWISNVTSPATQNVGSETKRPSTNFFTLTKRESQSILAFNAGAFMLKTSWGDYHEKKDCLAPMCDGQDQLEHIQICRFYKTRWRIEYMKDIKALAKYFVALDKERRRVWRGECLF